MVGCRMWSRSRLSYILWQYVRPEVSFGQRSHHRFHAAAAVVRICEMYVCPGVCSISLHSSPASMAIS